MRRALLALAFVLLPFLATAAAGAQPADDAGSGACPQPTQQDVAAADVVFQGTVSDPPPKGKKGGNATFVVLQTVKGELRPGEKVTVRITAARSRPVPEAHEGDIWAVLATGDERLTADMCKVVVLQQAPEDAAGGEEHEVKGLSARTLLGSLGLLLAAVLLVAVPGLLGRAGPGTPSAH